MDARDSMAYLYSCFDTMYVAYGEAAPTLTNDAYVIRAYEAGRAFGEVALAFRDYLDESPGEPVAPLEEALRFARVNDDTGTMMLYALALVVGPRVLVSLRDARDQVDFDDAALAVLNRGSMALVEEILKVGEVSKDQAPIDDPRWQEDAQALGRGLDESGNAESFGISR
ncbi:MAG TPA: hypothetical protein VGZ04_07630 [Acidimicrobiales bacterium]|jgi:hypothetical protein|nr:hypothetical protein [Acidimicrobiales bacterium]